MYLLDVRGRTESSTLISGLHNIAQPLLNPRVTTRLYWPYCYNLREPMYVAQAEGMVRHLSDHVEPLPSLGKNRRLSSSGLGVAMQSCTGEMVHTELRRGSLKEFPKLGLHVAAINYAA